MGQARTEGAGQQQLDKGHRRATAREKPEGHLFSASPLSKHANEQLLLLCRGGQLSKSHWH